MAAAEDQKPSGEADAADANVIPVVSDTGDGYEQQSAKLPFPVVAIGASAGGLEAYVELFQHLSPQTGMAFVVLSHLPPDQISHLPEIVARHTRMPALAIQTGMRPDPDHVYFLPPNARAALKHGLFELETRTGEGPFHPIDFFFHSLAA